MPGFFVWLPNRVDRRDDVGSALRTSTRRSELWNNHANVFLNRFRAKGDTAVIVLVQDQRLEGHLLDESSNGLGIMLPVESQLRARQQVRLIVRRCMLHAQVTNIQRANGGVRVGLKLRT